MYLDVNQISPIPSKNRKLDDFYVSPRVNTPGRKKESCECGGWAWEYVKIVEEKKEQSRGKCEGVPSKGN